jgi:protein-disulfide isomerase
MTETDSKLRPLPFVIILLLSLGAMALGAYQWHELVLWRTAGVTPLCSIGEHLNCSSVWDSPFSQWVQRVTRIPMPGWGIAWAAVTGVLAVRVLIALRGQRPAVEMVQSLRLTVWAGIVAVVTLLLYSALLKTFCPTCIGFYVFVALIAYYTLRHGRGVSAPWGTAILHSAAPLLIVVALLFYPGAKTPKFHASTDALQGVVKENAASQPAAANPMKKFLLSLQPQAQQAISRSLAKYRTAERLELPIDTKRLVYGTVSAPVHVAEWIDIRCPHCRHMEEGLQEIREYTPPGSWSWELHHFPLDGECNPVIKRSAGGVSCLAAKVMICMSGAPEDNALRDQMFKEQQSLTKDRIWQLAGTTPDQKAQLQQCVTSQKTQDALLDDIRLAMRFRIEGTPLIVINDKKADPIPGFIYSLILAKGRENDPEFQVLPAVAGGASH